MGEIVDRRRLSHPSAASDTQPGLWPGQVKPTLSVGGRRIAFAITGGIAAYKAIDCIRLLTEAEAEVRVLMTPEATQFVRPLTFEALTNHPVTSDWLAPRGGGEVHIELSEWAEALVVAPATANTLAKLAQGVADEIVSGTALATRAPLILAPAMNDRMFTHPGTQEHLQVLRQRQAVVVEPAVGRLASGKVAVGRLAAPERIVAVVDAVLAGRRNLEGLKVVISAGGTREPIDPVRFVGNYSSGKMGRALAEVAAARGAEVLLITSAPGASEGIEEAPVSTAQEMLEALQRTATDADVLIMAAAVADYRAPEPATSKIPRRDRDLDLRLVPNVDVLATLGKRAGLFRVGFAAETDDLEVHALAKLQKKELDLVVANWVGVGDQGMGGDFNAVTVFGRDGSKSVVARQTKWEVAHEVWDAVVAARKSLPRAG